MDDYWNRTAGELMQMSETDRAKRLSQIGDRERASLKAVMKVLSEKDARKGKHDPL